MIHFHGGHLFFTEETHFYVSTRFYRVDSFQRWRLMNELPVIESLCLRKHFWHRHVQHCNSLENGFFDHLYVHIFCRSSRDLPFLDKILQRVRGEKWQLKSLWVFLDKLSLDRGISFFIAYFILTKGKSSVKIIFISADYDFSPWRRHIFRRRN